MFFIPLLAIIIFIWFTVLLIKTFQNNLPVNNTVNNAINSNKAIEILKERYARGELSEEEFQKIKANLE